MIGDIAGYDFFNARGEHVNTVMDNRVIGLNIDELRQILRHCDCLGEHQGDGDYGRTAYRGD